MAEHDNRWGLCDNLVIFITNTNAMKTNKEWHLANRMPPNATLSQRVTWHIEHARHCACREMPEKIKEEIRKRKLKS